MEREQVNLEITIIRAQFTPANHTNPESGTSRYRFVRSRDRIMIGDRDSYEVRSMCCID